MLDLNLWPSGNGRARAPKNNPGTRVVSTRTKVEQSTELKAAEAFLKVLNTLTFNPKVFAVYLGHTELIIQRRVLDCLLAFVDLLANRLENGVDKSEEELELIFQARRAKDAMQFFRDNGML